ncbi:MAG: DUF1553 domain-containing protein [Cytophagaceae bacterium]|nr:DUF1553 domain-containing protein [Cytophagaceae bacterium]
MNVKLLPVTACLAAAAIGYFTLFRGSEKVDYSTQVKPILNKHCIACHGGVKKASGFSVLFRDEALAKTKSGKPAIIPGDAAHSEFIQRLTLKDPEERMPYKHAPLKPDEIEILKKWVDEGAVWGNHWAYVAPQAPEVPNSGLFAGISLFSNDWAKNDLDRFVKKRLDDENLKPTDEADRATLIRRVSLDLTGLPPTPEQLSKYTQADDWDIAYRALVDELLKSSAFGERWASMWLDLARYSDSRGYQKDNARTIWRYRDWVIKAFNTDMPYDRFTTEQLAGDLLPDRHGRPATKEQLIATAFHRNTMNNDETGTVDEEFRVAATVDRVNTTWEVWQGTSFGCVQCHSHPYDPFRHEEYYKFLAFFNNTRDEDTQDEAPNLREFAPEDQAKLQQLSQYFNQSKHQAPGTKHAKFNWLNFARFLEPRHHPHYADQYLKGALVGDRQIGLRHGGSCRLPAIQLDGKTQLLAALSVQNPGSVLEIRRDRIDGPLLARVVLDTTNRGKTENRYIPIKPVTGRHDLFLKTQNPKLLPDEDILHINWFAFLPDFPGKNSPESETNFRHFNDLLTAKTENTPILIPSNPDYQRPTYVWVRGNWLVPGQEVQPGVPHSLPTFGKLPQDRLGLARWLVSPDNPLTARVAVNRYWEQLFGIGLVETLEDFGTQGAKPTHPELLDYLAIKFSTDWKWSTKRLLRELVTSATYRQGSRVSRELQERDPQNRLLARGSRIRLPAEMVRDQALAVSGLLSRKMYGKPVMPYQPEGVWQAVNSNLNYKQSAGEDQYRRAVYTFARRTGPYPSALTFDAGSREVCLSRRIRTNTPLQALTLLNDPVFLEASQALAKVAPTSGRRGAGDQIAWAYQRVTGQNIPKRKKEKLTELYATALSRFRQKPALVKDFIPENGTPQLAALTVVTNAILNLDEVVVKE